MAVAEPVVPSQRNNQIKLLRPWKEGPLWIFNDDEAGLRREAFVSNASKLIDALVRKYEVEPDDDGKITLLFSHEEFPDSTKLELVDDSKGCGVTYEWHKRKLSAWLCPAFYHYFEVDSVPTELYAQAV